MLRVENLNKFYGQAHVLKGVSFNVEKGKVFCLLGPNGSGKTTLINCFLSLLKFDSGHFLYENQETRPSIGLIMEDDGFCRDLSSYKNLILTSIVKESPASEVEELLEVVSLSENKKKQVRKLSQGMRKRLSIASSLIGNPDFFVWDEPFNALDPDGFIFIRNLIYKKSAEGKTFLICTHLLDEVEKIADTVGLIYKGQMLSVMSKDEILMKFGTIENFYIHYTTK